MALVVRREQTARSRSAASRVPLPVGTSCSLTRPEMGLPKPAPLQGTYTKYPLPSSLRPNTYRFADKGEGGRRRSNSRRLFISAGWQVMLATGGQ